VQTTKAGGVNWIVEMKGRVWEGTAAKDEAVGNWCERVNAATGVAWRWTRVNQVHFDGRKPTKLAQVVDELTSS
jgi:type III restriction enzyme